MVRLFKLRQSGGMATALTVKIKMGTKLQISNLILILTVLIVTALSFQFLSSRYLLKEAKHQMKADAESIVLSLRGIQQLEDRSVGVKIARWNELRVAGRSLQSKIVVFNQADRIVYSNVSLGEMKKIKLLDQQGDSDYLIVRRPISTGAGDTIGRLFMAAKIKDVSGLNQLMRGAQIVSSVVGAAVALGLGLLFSRSITRPIRTLTAGMRKFSPKKELPVITVHTQDEIRELADSFMDMAGNLQANDRMQTDFLQNASHELKTPLMAIQGNAEAIKDGIVQEREAEESLDVIISECQRLKTVVDELIFLTRLDHVSETFRFESISIGKVIGDALIGVQGLAEQKGITLTVAGDVEVAGRFDGEKLKRAFINIIGNGIRYAKSKIVLQVVLSRARLEITCVDDGKGLAPGEEKLIFDRFYKGEQGGTGIGLAITKTIIEAHGGSIEALHGNPAGAVIRMVLPL